MTVTVSPRRVGAETSKTRDTLLDCVERMVFEQGYASVTYRALATKAGVTSSLVQYYFPTLDDIFLSAISRYAGRNLEVLTETLRSRPDYPLRALWEYSWDEATGALMTEFTALGNHRQAIRARMAEVTNQVRTLQLDALAAKYGANARLEGDMSLGAALLLITGLPKLLNLEESIGVDTAHADLISTLERLLDTIEPISEPRARTSTSHSRRR
ncbi:TetR/AcrR family transcriptional regulator [Nocardia salmonicida]|uniref:TetR/AcrR family transcriptional regulator n=1 Tax=Nocardia salmonicida TaxID=53431 RepID=UPI0037B3021B